MNARRIGLLAVATLGIACTRVEPTTIERAKDSGLDMSAPASLIGEVVEVRLVDSDGRSVADAEVGPLSGTVHTTDGGGRVRFVLSHGQLAAPVVYLRVTLASGESLHATVPAAAFEHELTLRLPAEVARDSPLQVVLEPRDPSIQAWFDAADWLADRRQRWHAAESVEAKRAIWQEVSDDIDAAGDDQLRALMTAAQFAIGRSDPELGLQRETAALQALERLPLDDPRWAMWPPALPAAVWESGRWQDFDALDEQVSLHPQPEVAAMIALERYGWAIAEGRWAQAEALWARWEARPALLATPYAKVVEAYGPNRRLAPGQHLPTLCAETLAGDRVCTDALDGLTVIEIYAVWCRGCRESFPKVAATIAGLADSELRPQLLTLEVYNEREQVEAFVRELPSFGRHAWLPAAERDSSRDALGIESVPTMVLIGPDGRILDSSPQLSADNLEARIHHWQTQLTDAAADAG